MDMWSEQGPECKASQARVGITERSPDDAETRRETDEKECEQVTSREVGKHSVNVTERVGLACMTVTIRKNNKRKQASSVRANARVRRIKEDIR